MEVLSIALFIAILVLMFSLKSNILDRLGGLEVEIRKLREQLTTQSREAPVIPSGEQIVPTVSEEITPPVSEEVVAPVVEQKPWSSGFKVVEEKPLSEELEALLANAQLGMNEANPDQKTDIPEPVNTLETASQQAPLIAPVRKPSFMERNPDLEKFIGENLISKIGIAILVLAIGFFVKYAIDNDWIGPVGRVGIGILCGGILAAVAHRLRNSYKAFSSVLTGGGLAIFYFTITLAYHQFHLFSQIVAFVIMVVITAFAVVLSQLYNRQELAIIALVGGFATPFMVSSGEGNYKSLFSYLIVLNAGLLFIAYNKAWRLLNLLAFIFTVGLFGSWLLTLKPGITLSTYGNGLLFATIFYFLFFGINIAHNIRENKKFIASDFGILLANTALYFAAGLYCLTAMRAVEYRGLFTASLGVINLAASFVLFRNRKIDNNILYLLIGVTLSFISLTAPIQLNGNNITIFWASESVLLYWLYGKSKIRIIRLTAFIVWAAMLVSLVMDWLNVYGSNAGQVTVMANRGFVTTVFSAIASYLLFILRKNDTGQPTSTIEIYPHYNVFRTVGVLLLFGAGAFEISYQFQYHYPASDFYLIYLLLYSFAFVLLFNLITSRFVALKSPWYIKTAALALCVIIYLFTIPKIFAIQARILQQRETESHFLAHWFSALLLGIIIFQLTKLLRAHMSTAIRTNNNLLTWMLCIAVVIFLSAEAHLLVNTALYSNENSLSNIQRIYVKTGLPILWGLCSFCFMWLGMKHKYRTLRIVSLTLFSIILLKLFIFDIRNIPVAGKIAAFFSLGVLLLVVSFMYQRLKRIIIEDEKKPAV